MSDLHADLVELAEKWREIAGGAGDDASITREACADELDALLRTHRDELLGVVEDAAKWRRVESVAEGLRDCDMPITTAACFALIDRAAEVNASRGEFKFERVFGQNDEDLGDWIVTVDRTRDAAIDAARHGRGE